MHAPPHSEYPPMHPQWPPEQVANPLAVPGQTLLHEPQLFRLVWVLTHCEPLGQYPGAHAHRPPLPGHAKVAPKFATQLSGQMLPHPSYLLHWFEEQPGVQVVATNWFGVPV
jgi:hypothetical protein